MESLVLISFKGTSKVFKQSLIFPSYKEKKLNTQVPFTKQ